MILLPLLAAATASCLWPDTPDHIRRIEGGAAVECKRKFLPPREVTPAEQAAIRKFFDNDLRDGPSARYRLGLNDNGIICGYVNAKNAFGGYTGWQPFTYNTKTKNGSIYEEERLWLYKMTCVDPYSKP